MRVMGTCRQIEIDGPEAKYDMLDDPAFGLCQLSVDYKSHRFTDTSVRFQFDDIVISLLVNSWQPVCHSNGISVGGLLEITSQTAKHVAEP